MDVSLLNRRIGVVGNSSLLILHAEVDESSLEIQTVASLDMVPNNTASDLELLSAQGNFLII